MRILRSVTAAAILIALAGCAGGGGPEPAVGSLPVAAGAMPLRANHGAADALIRGLPAMPELQQPILVASLVDVNRLDRSSGFGRIASEQIGARLANAGLPVSEIKLRDGLLVQEGRGELMLSRDIRDLAGTRSAQAVVVGTYAVGRDSVFVNVRMVGAADGRVLSAHDYVVPITADVAALLNSDIEPLMVAAPGETIVY